MLIDILRRIFSYQVLLIKLAEYAASSHLVILIFKIAKSTFHYSEFPPDLFKLTNLFFTFALPPCPRSTITELREDAGEGGKKKISIF